MDRGSSGMMDPRSINDNYVIFHPRDCGVLDVFLSLFPDATAPCTRCTPSLRAMVDGSWQAKFTMFMMTLLHTVARGLAIVGKFMELWLNTLHANGGPLKIALKIITREALRVPQEGSEDYWSVVGLLDPRTDLLIHQISHEFVDHGSYFTNEPPASKLIADACMMASKLAYENSKIIRKVANDEWKMHVVGVFECINKYQQMNPSQVAIFMDRAEDAQVIMVTFRGTMAFNAYDWSSNFDFSWYELPGLGRIHVGFLEALSLVDRHDMITFARLKRNISETGAGQPERMLSGLSEAAYEENKPLLAYDIACDKLKELLAEHKNAKVYVTGHSLGGALATVFTGMLFHSKEDLVTSRIAAVYTFGQPRGGDKEFAANMFVNLNDPENRYFRVVYCNDLVPRLPYADLVFQFKHLGPCFFYNSAYKAETMNVEPERNFSPANLLPTHAAATWELLQGFLLQYKFGEGFKESVSSLVLRLIGLAFPGVAAHSPVNYVNAVRLGPEVLDPEVMPSFESKMEELSNSYL